MLSKRCIIVGLCRDGKIMVNNFAIQMTKLLHIENERRVARARDTVQASRVTNYFSLSRFSRYTEPFARLLIYLLALERSNTSTLHRTPLPVSSCYSQPRCTNRNAYSFRENLLPTIRFPQRFFPPFLYVQLFS